VSTTKALESILAKAESHLQQAVKLLAGGAGDQSTAREAVEKARANCRDARAALTRVERAEHR
jgi:hypothetical protein